MKRFGTAVVIGKFYPPHRGHKHLIDTAAGDAEHVTVFVCDEDGQTISGETRAAWIREIHPGVQVRVVRSTLADDDSDGWAKSTIEWLGRAPDAVFTSEEYGDRYAGFMNSTHVMVDPQRRTVPVSGTQIRGNPLEHLDHLEPCVRSHFIKRIVIIGAESSGTTTLAQALADHYRTVWVPEFGRMYWEARQHSPGSESWRSDEFVFIARQQAALEDALAPLANRVLICDTDPFATTVWHERYLGYPSPEVQAVAAARRCDLYVLTDVDIPFVQDGTREGERIRSWMHRRFLDELGAGAVPFVIVSGSRTRRIEAAITRIDPFVTGDAT
jgi:NadR type nicotinamide-nucleotide adenylyltransferase